MINSTDILSGAVAELSQLIVQILDTAFLSHSLGGLGTMYDFHLGLTGKRLLDFLLVIIELFSLDVTAEALWANRSKVGDFAPTRSV